MAYFTDAKGSALINVKGKDGKSIFSGRKVTGFSNVEEEQVGKTKVIPWLLEDKVRNPLSHSILSAADGTMPL